MSTLKIWEQTVIIQTYETGDPNPNPMFFEKRVYQGSSGKVYPIPVTDKIFDEKVPKPYKIVFLENEFIQVQIMPELGGKIYRAIDKTIDYDFVYYNQVIKPALVGLAGPWVSGGIEFNWPQHHRPNTFGPVEYFMDSSDPNKVTLWISETDRMYGTKVTTGFTLHMSKSYIEISANLYNPTSEPQTFLWWANPAVAVHDETQSIFPPDVTAVMDHGKRDVSRFPIATGTYYKQDYSAGVDISYYKNIPVPTSYMAYKSEYDFVGGYDYKVDAGILHIADHHISPGKKQWTWGCGDFGKAWDRNLTDEDGPYIELMTGMYTDNQPDFTWLQPYEEKTFTQYFMPYKKVGKVKNATINTVLGADLEDGLLKITLYTTSEYENIKILLKDDTKVYMNETVNVSPTNVFYKEIAFSETANFDIIVKDVQDKILVSYSKRDDKLEKLPSPAVAIGSPKSLDSVESLYLAGLHIEQYRHATYEPDQYYLEGLRRDENDIRTNNAYGNLLLRRCDFETAEKHFRTAIKTSTKHNPNPYDGEPFYNLGKALHYQDKLDEAFDMYYKSTWSDAQQSKGFLKLGQISAIKQNFADAIMFGQKSLFANYKNYKARNLLTAMYRKTGNLEKLSSILSETMSFDPMDFFAHSEYAILKPSENLKNNLHKLLRNDPHNYIFLSESYAEIGLFQEAISVLEEYIRINKNENIYPMIFYYLGNYAESTDDVDPNVFYKKGAAANSTFCFPNSIRDMIVLEKVVNTYNDSKALYYLGNLFYDKKRYDKAILLWEKSLLIDNMFPTVHRNLSLAYANKHNDFDKAKKHMEMAFNLNTTDARVFYELIELYKKLSMPKDNLLIILESNLDLVFERDDLYIEYVSALNFIGLYEKSIKALQQRNFHPWEGGEGKVYTLYKDANIGLAKIYIFEQKYEQAIQHLEESKIYRSNFGEGKLENALENDIDYFLGIAYSFIDTEKSNEYFNSASTGNIELTNALYYNDQPPHLIYYKGLALKQIGETDKANSVFNKLVNYGEENIFVEQAIDYFAVSLPDFLVFDTDINLKNKVHCNYMMALGHLGLGNLSKAEKFFKESLDLDPNNYNIISNFNEII